MATELRDLGGPKCPWFTYMVLSSLCSAPLWPLEKEHPSRSALRGPWAVNEVRVQLARLAKRDGVPQRQALHGGSTGSN